MGNFGAAIDEPISDPLKYGNLSRIGLYLERPGGLVLRFRPVIQTQADAELTLLPVSVLFQFRATLVGSDVHIRRLDGLAGNCCHRARQLMMKKSRHTFVVRPITSRTLLITERDLSRANQLAIVPTESSQMKGMNQTSNRRVLPLPEGCS